MLQMDKKIEIFGKSMNSPQSIAGLSGLATAPSQDSALPHHQKLILRFSFRNDNYPYLLRFHLLSLPKFSYPGISHFQKALGLRIVIVVPLSIAADLGDSNFFTSATS